MKNTKLKSVLFTLTSLVCMSALFCIPAVIPTKAEEVKVYVSDNGTGDGSSADAPLSDLGTAIQQLANTGGRVVLVGYVSTAKSSSYNGSNTFTEPTHAKAITIDGSQSGAVLDIGTSKRYYLGGDTVFENVTFGGGGASLIAARFNHLTFEEGCNTSVFSQLYLLGGYNTGVTGTYSIDPRITLKSGKFYQVVGFNRMTTNNKCSTTAHIDLYEGVSVDYLFASVCGTYTTYTGNTAGGMDVNVYGATIGRASDTDRSFNCSLGAFSLNYVSGDIKQASFSNTDSATLTYSAETADKVAAFKYMFDRIIAPDGTTEADGRIKIACIGDSITAGVGASSADTYSYPAQLAGMLGRQYDVANFGVGGSVITNTSSKAYTATANYTASLEFEPDIVLFMLGTNDISLLLNGQQDAVYADALEIIGAYQQLPSKPQIYILSSTARSDTIERREGVRDILVPLQKKLAQECGAYFVDMCSLTWEKTALFPDSLHPNDIGYSMMAAHIARIIEAAESKLFYDINLDGKINNRDAVTLIRYLAGW